jgi:hypothetical protein
VTCAGTRVARLVPVHRSAQPAEQPSKLETAVVWIMRAVIVANGVVNLVVGDIPYALFCFLGVVVVSLPGLIARTRSAVLPAELDIVLLLLLFLDATAGRLGGLYELIPWYDKALHFGVSFAIAMIAFLFVYILHFTGRTDRHAIIDAIMIFLITAGLGAIWEIAEYGVDQLLGRATQGSPQLAAFPDTMVDLMLDGIGGAIAALIGTLWMKYSKRSARRIERFAKLLDARRPADPGAAGHRPPGRRGRPAPSEPATLAAGP